MGIQSALILSVAVALLAAGLLRMRRSRRRRGKRGRERAGLALTLVGGILIIILLATGGL